MFTDVILTLHYAIQIKNPFFTEPLKNWNKGYHKVIIKIFPQGKIKRGSENKKNELIYSFEICNTDLTFHSSQIMSLKKDLVLLHASLQNWNKHHEIINLDNCKSAFHSVFKKIHFGHQEIMCIHQERHVFKLRLDNTDFIFFFFPKRPKPTLPLTRNKELTCDGLISHLSHTNISIDDMDKMN